jgi:hypothetical protein
MRSPLIRVEITRDEIEALQDLAATARVSVARLIGDAIRAGLLKGGKP